MGRLTGLSTARSLEEGLAETAGTISTAGAMMAIAFSGLLFSSLPILRQIGLLLVTGTILDTWFIRPVVVPACMLIGDPEMAWWPRRMPPIITSASAHASLIR